MSLSEAETRKSLIEKALVSAGWSPIVDYSSGTLIELGSVREYQTANGPADYILFVEGGCYCGRRVKGVGAWPDRSNQWLSVWSRVMSYAESRPYFSMKLRGHFFGIFNRYFTL